MPEPGIFYSKRVKAGKIVSMESKSVNRMSEGFEPSTEAEYLAFIASLPPPSPPVDRKAEWAAATNPAEKMRVLGRMLGLE